MLLQKVVVTMPNLMPSTIAIIPLKINFIFNKRCYRILHFHYSSFFADSFLEAKLPKIATKIIVCCCFPRYIKCNNKIFQSFTCESFQLLRIMKPRSPFKNMTKEMVTFCVVLLLFMECCTNPYNGHMYICRLYNMNLHFFIS